MGGELIACTLLHLYMGWEFQLKRADPGVRQQLHFVVMMSSRPHPINANDIHGGVNVVSRP